MATSRVAERLDAPRNKISGLTGVPPLRRFFNHPTDIPLREIIEARDILIVDANMGAIGTENSKACMLFILRMLHAQLQRQVHLPEAERPRVPLLVDEAHYVAGGENVVDQIATHRAAGLEPAFGLQYFAQLGSASEHQQKILKGVLNLLQSRFLFRMGDAEDAEEATRIAMAVYATMIRDDPDSRARLRVTPEQALNFPNYYCLASWIANGTRAPSFIGQTYPLPDVDDEWAEHHLAAQAERVGPYPEQLESTLDARAAAAAAGRQRQPDRDAQPTQPSSPREYLAVPYDEKDAAKRLGARWDPDAQSWFIPAGVDPEPLARWRVAVAYRERRHAKLGDRQRNRTAEECAGRASPPIPRRRPSQAATDARASARCASTTSRRPSRRTSPTARSAGSSDAGYPGRRSRASTGQRRTASASSRSSTGSTRSAPPSSSPAPTACHASTTRTTRSSRCSTAPAWHRARMIGRAVFPERSGQRRHRPPDQALPSRADRPAHDRACASTPATTASCRCCTRSPAAAWRSPRRASRRRRSRPGASGERSSSPTPAGSRTTCTRSAGRSNCTAPLGDARHRPLAHPALRHRPLPRPPGRLGPRRHPITLNEIPVPDGQAIIDVELEDLHRGQARPLARAADRHDQADASTCSSSSTSPPARRTTATSSSPTTRSCAAGASPTRATRPRARGPPSCSCAPTPRAALALRARGRRGADRPDRSDGHRAPSTGTTPGRDHIFFAVESRHPPRRPVRARAARRSRPGCASDSPAAASSRSSASRCSPTSS